MLSLAHSTVGAGRPLLIAHGLLGQARNWRSLQNTFAQRLPAAVTTVDLRNHGRSPHASTMSMEEMAEDVAGLLSDLHGERATAVLGHSMGGKVAVHLALTRPAAVERLVVVDVAPVKYHAGLTGGHAELLDAMMAVPLEQVSTLDDVRKMLAPRVPDVAVREFLLTNLAVDPKPRWLPPLATLRQQLAEVRGSPDYDAGECYEGPTLFIGGGNSDYITAHHHGRIRRLFPRVQFVTIAGAGHWVHAERPHEFVAAVTQFLQQ